jgi:Holliday junction resolvase
MSGKGVSKERDLQNAFEDEGWFAKRAGGSGAGSDSASYDVIAAKNGRVLVIELKYSDPDNYVYVDGEKVHELIEIADQFGTTATPLLAARWKQDTTFYGHKPETCHQTNSGNYRLDSAERETADIHLPPAGTIGL